MKIFRSFEEAKNIINPVVTTGSFDGVHIGHKTILNRLRMLAEKYHGESVLITFDPHPRKVLYPDTAGKDLKLINSQEEKLDLLEQAGLDNVIIVEFTREFSKITSEQFVRDFLHGILHAKVVVAGFNHHFGFNKEGDYKQLWDWQGKYHFEAEEIPENYRIENSLDLPALLKIPLTEECKILPSSGIYAVSVESGLVNSKGMVIIHGRPDKSSEVLVNIFDEMNLSSDSKITISFHKKIHGAINFSDSKAILKVNTAKEEISELIY